MSDGFLSRWSRRKAGASAGAKAALPEPPRAEAVPEAGASGVGAPGAEVPGVELPDIETLGSGSDYTAFLQKGVAAEVQRRALQRAWESDAGIAAFRGMADYDWDFNAPTYGRLWPTDNVAELLRAVLASPEPEPEPEPAVVPVALPTPVAMAAAVPGEPMEPAIAASAAGPDPAEAEPPTRRHGSAMPC